MPWSKNGDDEQVRREVEALKRFNGIVHPHLITLLCTFTQDSEYHMIFPWAQSDLKEYWKRNPTPDMSDVKFCRWILKQCVGITEAIEVIHNPRHITSAKRFGWHGAIKPENILWFKSKPGDPHDRGRLVISDFSLSEIHTEKSRSMRANDRSKLTFSYRPPECNVEGGMIGRALDIWTLGCLYLEMVCWLLKGYGGLRRFAETRMVQFMNCGAEMDLFFEIKSKDAEHNYTVKDAVAQVSYAVSPSPKGSRPLTIRTD